MKIEFNQHIRPILSDNCFKCHGPDKEQRQAELRLDTPEGIVADLGGYQAVTPGDLLRSELVKRITHEDPDERMPPEESHRSLTEQQISLLEQWISEGAQWQEHWSFEPIERHTPPEFADSQWVRNPVDAFIFRKLRSEELAPSSQASKRVLVRRLALDLTGLPPTRETVESFVSDPSENAYENLVDRLLAAKSFGEHRAHYWLDAARYADTHGFHLDNYRSIWPYRDWVVDAFNANMPFDQFTIEQLAGDLLENPTTSQLIATGFNRSNSTSSEGGAIDEEYLAIYASDRTETTSTVWLGLTVGCARCHDHKFDPIKQQEFYKFAAFFRNTTQPAMDGNSSDSPPYLMVTAPGDVELRKSITDEMTALRTRVERQREQSKDEFTEWLAAGGAIEPAIPVAASVLEFSASLNEGGGREISGTSILGPWNATIDGDHKWDSSSAYGEGLAITNETSVELPAVADFNLNDSFTLSFWLRLPAEKTAVNPLIGRFDIDDTDRGWGVSVNADGNPVLYIRGDKVAAYVAYTKEGLERETWQHVALTYNGTGASNGFTAYVNGEVVEVTANNVVFRVSKFTDAESVTRGLVIGGLVAADVKRAAREKKEQEKTELARQALEIAKEKNEAQEEVQEQQDEQEPDDKVAAESIPEKEPGFVVLQDIRIFHDVISDEDVRQLYRVPQLRQTQSADNTAHELRQKYFASQISPEGIALANTARVLRGKLAAIDRRSAVTLIMEEKPDSLPEAHVLTRGQYDQPGEKVSAGVPAVFAELPGDKTANRLALANWLVDPNHPLTARVTVNRFWQELFGVGLVATSEDFGSQGEPPSHPQLLDWLAGEFIDSGWNVKHLFKLMVSSATYRQDSAVNERLIALDPDNRLLARGPRYRLDAEVIRDQALQLSGLLVDKLGGPPVKPYQPQGIWQAVGFSTSNTVQFYQDHGEDLYRRSLYTFHKRTAAPPSMALFDAASRQNCAMRRGITNTPMQALVLLNDPQFVEAARNLAQNTLLAETENRFAYLLERTLIREPDEAMVAVLRNTYATVVEKYRGDLPAATAIVNVGESGWLQELDVVELAAWTILASQILNLDEMITKP